jgi:NitT/TauT family transport system substrate-binding protein
MLVSHQTNPTGGGVMAVRRRRYGPLAVLRRVRGATCLSLVLFAVLTACTSASSVPRVSGLEKTSLTVSAVPVADDAGLYIAQDEGLFAAEGLRVKIDSSVSGQLTTTGQNNGKYDVTAGNAVSYIQAQVTGRSNLEIVAEGSVMQQNNQALYTMPGSRITKIADLRHARIGVNVLNNIGTLLISSVLVENGLSPKDVTFVQIKTGFPGMMQALQSHTIDVAWLPEPFGSADELKYGVTQLTDLDQGATMNFPVSWYVVTKAWAKKYPHTLAAFLDALRQGQEIADTNRSAVEQAMEKLPAPYTVAPIVAAVMSLESYPLDTAPNIDGVRVQRVADAMFQFGMLQRRFRVSSMLTP